MLIHRTMRYLSGMLKVLKNILLFMLLILVIVALIGAFIFALYRIASTSRALYSYIFVAVLGATLFFFIARSIRRKTFVSLAFKFLRFFYGLFIVGTVAAIFFLLGAFLLRYPLIGAISTPIVVGGVILLFLKWKPFQFLKNISKQ